MIREASLAHDVAIVQKLLESASPADKMEYQNSCKALNDAFERLRKHLPADVREALGYIRDREVSNTMQFIVDHLRSEVDLLNAPVPPSK